MVRLNNLIFGRKKTGHLRKSLKRRNYKPVQSLAIWIRKKLTPEESECQLIVRYFRTEAQPSDGMPMREASSSRCRSPDEKEAPPAEEPDTLPEQASLW